MDATAVPKAIRATGRGPISRIRRDCSSESHFIPKAGLPPAMLHVLLRVAASQNPEFYKVQSMRLSTYDKPRVIACGDDLRNHVALPRGSLSDAVNILEQHSIKVIVRDERVAGAAIAVEFRGSF